MYGLAFFVFPQQIAARIGENLGLVENEPLYIKAESLRYLAKHHLFVAEGNVDITYRQSHLTADRVEFNELTGDAIAIGNVRYEEDGETVAAERTELNFDTEEGEIFQGALAFEGNHYITGYKIEKTGEETYVVYRGSYTACRGDSPAWSFRCTRAKVEQGEYLQAWNAVGYVKGIPIIYFPYIVYPIKNERQSGFLVPDIGRSTNNGFTLTNAYFWALSPSQDVTLSHTYYEKRGHRFDLEYRYLYSGDTDGTLLGKYFPDQESEEVKRRLSWNHRQELPYDIKTIVNLDLTSDDQFDQDFETDLDARTKRELKSNVSFTKKFSQHTIRLLFDRLDNLREENTDQAKQTFPELQVKSQIPKIFGTPLDFSQQTKLSRLQEEGKDAKEFGRLDMYATFRLPITIIDQALTLTPAVNLRETYYTRDATTAADQDLEAKPVHREYYDVTVDLNGPKLNRIFDLGNAYRIQKVKHLIEPHMRFSFVPEIETVNVPKFDGIDWSSRNRSRTLQYGVTQRLLAKRVKADDWKRFHDDNDDIAFEELDTENKEIASLSLNQSYSFEADRRKFSDISLRFTTTPLEPYTVTVDSSYDVYIQSFVKTNVNVQAQLWNFWTVGVRWNRTATVKRETDDITAIHRSLNVDTQLILFEDSSADPSEKTGLRLTYSGQFNVENGKHIKDSFGLTYSAQCWNVTASYAEQLISDTRDKSFRILLDLKNLGQLFDIRG